jgi:hypothetical protein
MSAPERILRNLLIYLEGLAREPSHLPETKLNREKVAVLELIARGWKRLAGVSEEDIEALIDLVGSGGTVLFDNRKGAPGRQWDSKERALVDTDKLVMTDIRGGMTVDAAIRKYYGEHFFEANKTRIKRLRREEREIISLQTPD